MRTIAQNLFDVFIIWKSNLRVHREPPGKVHWKRVFGKNMLNHVNHKDKFKNVFSMLQKPMKPIFNHWTILPLLELLPKPKNKDKLLHQNNFHVRIVLLARVPLSLMLFNVIVEQINVHQQFLRRHVRNITRRISMTKKTKMFSILFFSCSSTTKSLCHESMWDEEWMKFFLKLFLKFQVSMVDNVFRMVQVLFVIVHRHLLEIVVKHQVSQIATIEKQNLLINFVVAATPCQPNPCQNGGVCHVQGSTFICQCPSTFTGRCCETRLTTTTPFNPCAASPCQNNARCVPTGSSKMVKT